MDPNPDPERRGEQETEGGVRGNKGNGDADGAKEKNVASFVSSSFEEETKEPWSPPLLSLGDVMLNPDPDQLHSTIQTNKHKDDMYE